MLPLRVGASDLEPYREGLSGLMETLGLGVGRGSVGEEGVRVLG